MHILINPFVLVLIFATSFRLRILRRNSESVFNRKMVQSVLDRKTSLLDGSCGSGDDDAASDRTATSSKETVC